MPLSQALARCPDAVHLVLPAAQHDRAAARLLAALARVSPLVEARAPGCAFVGLQGLAEVGDPAAERRLARTLQQAVQDTLGLTPRMGVADSRCAALVAARYAPAGAPRAPSPVPSASPSAASSSSAPAAPSAVPAPAAALLRPHTPVPAWEEPGRPLAPLAACGPGLAVVAPGAAAAALLAPLPVRRLPLPAGMEARLMRLGLRTAGELAALPRPRCWLTSAPPAAVRGTWRTATTLTGPSVPSAPRPAGTPGSPFPSRSPRRTPCRPADISPSTLWDRLRQRGERILPAMHVCSSTGGCRA